jgi:hypothetical protein
MFFSKRTVFEKNGSNCDRATVPENKEMRIRIKTKKFQKGLVGSLKTNIVNCINTLITVIAIEFKPVGKMVIINYSKSSTKLYTTIQKL